MAIPCPKVSQCKRPSNAFIAQYAVYYPYIFIYIVTELVGESVSRRSRCDEPFKAPSRHQHHRGRHPPSPRYSLLLCNQGMIRNGIYELTRLKEHHSFHRYGGKAPKTGSRMNYIVAQTYFSFTFPVCFVGTSAF